MENNTQLLVNQVLHLYIQRSMHLLRDLKIHPGQCGMLWGLSQNDGLSQKELASKMGITPPSITVMIRKMEAEDLIERMRRIKELPVFILQKREEKSQRIWMMLCISLRKRHLQI